MNATSEVLANDDRVIATKWTMSPDSETGHHTHNYDYVVVYLSDGMLTVTSEAGEIEVPVAKHQLTSRPAGVRHNVMNRTAEPLEFIEIEIK
ncbi:MAG: cupin domain-containing protein [Chloroflexota bacterium]